MNNQKNKLTYMNNFQEIHDRKILQLKEPKKYVISLMIIGIGFLHSLYQILFTKYIRKSKKRLGPM